MPTNIANTDSSFTRTYNAAEHNFDIAAAASYPNASSLVHGLSYNTSALNLTNEFLETADQGKSKWQVEQDHRQTSRAPAPGAAKLSHGEAYFTLNDHGGSTTNQDEGNRGKAEVIVIEDDEDDEMVTLHGSYSPDWNRKECTNVFFRGFRTRTSLGDGDEWITLTGKAASPVAYDDNKEEKEDGNKENADSSLLVTPESTSARQSSSKQAAGILKTTTSKKETTTESPSIKKARGSKKSTKHEKKSMASGRKQVASTKKTATGSDKAPSNPPAAAATTPTTPAKRRSGRPLGYRKQPDGSWAYPDGSTVKSKSCSNSIDGDKKRKAPPAAAASNPSRKRQRKKAAGKKADGSGAESSDV